MNKIRPAKPPAARRRRFHGSGWVTLFVALVSSAALAQPRVPGAPQTIAAPHYGDTLFNFYLDRTFSAITGLMVSQHFGRVGPHDDEAEVLRGGMLLAYGLHDEAAQVFARLIERNATPEVQNRAWFFLAKLRYQRALPAEAELALANISAALPGALEDEHQLLRAQLLMRRADYSAAATVLQALQVAQAAPQRGPRPAPHAALYARFNLGVALIKAGDVAGGRVLLDAVGQVPAPDEELRGLRDRANLALGFATLAEKRPREARLALQRVRLNGPMSNKALLGFGWAAAELKDPQLALAPWTELAARGSAGGADASVLEARIAVPYAMAELRAYQSALQGYRQAAEGFETEQRALTESVAAIRAGLLVRGLLAGNADPSGLAVSAGIRTLPEMPHAAHLAPLLAGHDFQEAFKNLRDLQFLEANLSSWREQLGAFTDMLDNRRRAFEQRLPAVRAHSGPADIQALVQRRDVQAAELETALAQNQVAVFADAREQGLLQRLSAGQATLKAAATQPSTEGLDGAAERLRRAAGALEWQLSQAFSARSWEAKKALRVADTTLAQARERDAALTRAQQEEPARHAAFSARLAALAERVAALRPLVAAASLAVQGQLQDIAVAELQGQQERLAVYAAQARLAIAQIHDQAQFARRGDSAATEQPR